MNVNRGGKGQWAGVGVVVVILYLGKYNNCVTITLDPKLMFCRIQNSHAVATYVLEFLWQLQYASYVPPVANLKLCIVPFLSLASKLETTAE